MPCPDLRTGDWRLHGSRLPRGSWFRAELWGRHRYGVTPLPPDRSPAPGLELRAGPTLGRTTHPVSHSCEEPGRAPKCYYPMSPLRSFGQPAGALPTCLPAQRCSAVGSSDRVWDSCSPGGGWLFKEGVHITSHRRHRQRAFPLNFIFYF